ncbi:Aminopeptidase M1 [Camellia lanceoleosa]|nr:Aminopeptidase M1 [Camellia lanceoleosa]
MVGESTEAVGAGVGGGSSGNKMWRWRSFQFHTVWHPSISKEGAGSINSSGCTLQGFTSSIHYFQLCDCGGEYEVLDLFMWINHWNGSRSLHLHLQLAIVVTHEVAHQWFGNLVTMEWWTHLWLNEGFATWMSYLVTDTLFLEWEIWTKFLEDTAGGLHLDALETSHPRGKIGFLTAYVEIHYARSIDEIADDI